MKYEYRNIPKILNSVNTEWFRYFVILSELGNFQEAAKQLNITQQALSKAVSGIEKQLGVKLIERKKDFNIAKSSLKLAAGSILNFSFYLEPASEGKYSIIEKYKYTIKNVDDSIDNGTFISPIEPKPEIELISEYSQVNPGQKFIVVVNLKNPSRFFDLENIMAKLNVDYNNELSQTLSRLAKNQSYTIISSTFIAPQSLDSKDEALSINLVVDYSLDEIPKSINRSLELKFGSQAAQQPAASEAQPTASQSETAAEAQAAPPAQQETAPSQSQQESAATEIIWENLPAKKFKVNFLDKRTWAIAGVVFIVIFVMPAVVYSIKKKKRLQVQQPQAPQPPDKIKK